MILNGSKLVDNRKGNVCVNAPPIVRWNHVTQYKFSRVNDPNFLYTKV